MTSLRELLHMRRMSGLLSGLSRVHLLRAGIELGLFEALRQPQSEAQLAERLGLVRDLVGAWLRASRSHGLVRRSATDPATYRIGSFPRWLLDAPESAALLAQLDRAVEGYAPLFARLPELMKGAERPRFGTPDDARRAAEASRWLEQRALETLARIPGVRNARRLLDVGCGHGTYLAALLRRYRDAQGLGIEREERVAEEARRRLREADVARRGDVRLGDFMSMELPPGTYDLALINNALHYFPPAEHEALFRRALSRLVPGGLLAVQVSVLSESSAARFAGLSAAASEFDLFLRAHANLYGLPELPALHAALEQAGFARTGERAILPGGAARYVFAEAARA